MLLTVVYAKVGRRDAIYRNNRHYLVQNIEMHSLMKRLKSDDILTDFEGRIIGRGKDNQFKAFAYFENVLKRIDDERHSTFLLCLRQTNQQLVTKVIENGGGSHWICLHFLILHNEPCVVI